MAGNIQTLLAGLLQGMTHAQLSEELPKIAGLVVPSEEGLSKRQRIDMALSPLSGAQMAQFALKFAVHRRDVGLDEACRKVIEAGELPLS